MGKVKKKTSKKKWGFQQFELILKMVEHKNYATVLSFGGFGGEVSRIPNLILFNKPADLLK